jgi:serine/threonine-protein phosphatase 4 regulatory subunit 1
LQESNQTLRHGVISSLAKFISVFGVKEREYMIDLLLTVQKDRNKWRSRMVIATSIFPLTQCFQPETVFYVIAPILFKMCSDPVASVRRMAAKNVKHLLVPFQEGSQERNSLEDHIRAFSISKRFNQRQS